MAVVQLLDGSRQFIRPDVGERLWLIWNGEVEGDDRENARVAMIDKLYLNWRVAPDSYLIAHKDVLTEIVLSCWDWDDKGPYRVPNNDPDVERISELLGLTTFGLNMNRLEPVEVPPNELNERD